MIESIAVADDSVTLVVSAMPAGAAVQFMDLLKVVCAADLESLQSGDGRTEVMSLQMGEYIFQALMGFHGSYFFDSH